MKFLLRPFLKFLSRNYIPQRHFPIANHCKFLDVFQDREYQSFLIKALSELCQFLDAGVYLFFPTAASQFRVDALKACSSNQAVQLQVNKMRIDVLVTVHYKHALTRPTSVGGWGKLCMTRSSEGDGTINDMN